MQRYNLALWAIGLVCLAACATSGGVPPGVVVEHEGRYEQCINLRAGERVRYSYSASEEVDFNVHHHLAERTTYVARAAGELGLQIAWRACFLWTNRSGGSVRLRYNLRWGMGIVA